MTTIGIYKLRVCKYIRILSLILIQNFIRNNISSYYPQKWVFQSDIYIQNYDTEKYRGSEIDRDGNIIVNMGEKSKIK